MNLIEKRDHLEKLKDKLVFQKKENKIFNSKFDVKKLEKVYLSIMD